MDRGCRTGACSFHRWPQDRGEALDREEVHRQTVNRQAGDVDTSESCKWWRQPVDGCTQAGGETRNREERGEKLRSGESTAEGAGATPHDFSQTIDDDSG